MNARQSIESIDKLIEYLTEYSTSPELRPHIDLQASVPEFPLHFYDRHLDSRLTLMQVKSAPPMHQLLADFCDEELKRFKSTVKVVPTVHIPEHSGEMGSARDYAHLYHGKLAQLCLPFPSVLYLHPDLSDWKAVTVYIPRRPSRNRLSTFVAEADVHLDYAYQYPYNPASDETGFYLPTEPDVRKLYEIATHSPSLALWHFYPLTMSGEKVVAQMSDVSSFPWETSNTVTPHPVTPKTYQNDPDDDTGLVTRLQKVVSSRGRKITATKPRTLRRTIIAAIPSVAKRDFNSERPYRVDWRHFLQHVSLQL